jgi:hypothetical protein
MKLTELEKLSQLVYKKRARNLTEWIIDNKINAVKICNIGNDRVVFIHENNTVYIGIAGSDDKQDWKENFQLKTLKKLFYGYRGLAIPAADVIREFKQFRIDSGLNRDEITIIPFGHSRGGGIASNVYVQLKNKYEYPIELLYGWGFGNQDGGGVRFRKRAGHCNFINFDIKGDPVPNINIFGRKIGETVVLKKQISGFFNRIKMMFRGEMNHKSYDCINSIYPWKAVDERGEILYFSA